jgi:hypothetical protein
MLLSLYDPYEDFFVADSFQAIPLRHLASELAIAYGYSDKADLDKALDDAFDVCLMMGIPISDHFKKVYLYENTGMSTDWLLSDLGSYLLLMNGNSRNLAVAKARLYVYTLSKKPAL